MTVFIGVIVIIALIISAFGVTSGSAIAGSFLLGSGLRELWIVRGWAGLVADEGRADMIVGAVLVIFALIRLSGEIK